MNRLTIYGMVVTIVALAGFIAIQPLQQANAVHTTLLASGTQLRTAALAATAGDAGGIVRARLTCDQPFNVVTVASDNETDGGANNARDIITDWDGAGASFDPTTVVATAALGAAGTDVVDDDKAIASGTNGRVDVRYTNFVAADVIDAAVGFITTNSAVCSLTRVVG